MRLTVTDEMVAKFLSKPLELKTFLKDLSLLICPAVLHVEWKEGFNFIQAFYHLYLSFFNTIWFLYISGTIIRRPTI